MTFIYTLHQQKLLKNGEEMRMEESFIFGFQILFAFHYLFIYVFLWHSHIFLSLFFELMFLSFHFLAQKIYFTLSLAPSPSLFVRPMSSYEITLIGPISLRFHRESCFQFTFCQISAKRCVISSKFFINYACFPIG